MTDIRDSQVTAKALVANEAEIRDTQVLAKSLSKNPATIRDSQAAAKVLAVNPATIRDSQAAAKVLAANPATIRDSQVLAKVLHATTPAVATGAITLDINLMMDNGNDALIFLPDEMRIDQTTQGHLDLIVSVTTTEQVVSFVGIAEAGQVVLQNLNDDADNYVRYGKSPGSYIGRIYGAKPKRSGTADKLGWEPGAALYIVGNVAQKVRVIVCEK